MDLFLVPPNQFPENALNLKAFSIFQEIKEAAPTPNAAETRGALTKVLKASKFLIYLNKIRIE